MEICPKEKKKKIKHIISQSFLFKKNAKNAKNCKKYCIEEIAHFSKISKRNFSKLPKTKKEFTDSALIIQERDFSHL
jgi:hypothetical protein